MPEPVNTLKEQSDKMWKTIVQQGKDFREGTTEKMVQNFIQMVMAYFPKITCALGIFLWVPRKIGGIVSKAWAESRENGKLTAEQSKGLY